MAAVIIALLAIAAYWYWTSGGNLPGFPPAENSGLPTAASDTSDEAIDKDTAAIDAELNAAASDSGAVDRSLNDTPVQQ